MQNLFCGNGAIHMTATKKPICDVGLTRANLDSVQPCRLDGLQLR
jgi:hypothetical protein